MKNVSIMAAMGIPVNISGKSIYYDRPTPAKH